jgi:hypothetical protein
MDSDQTGFQNLSHRFPWEAFSALKLASILLPISAILSSFQAMTALNIFQSV